MSINHNDPLTGYLRAISICVFRHGSRILVGEGYDPTKDQRFYRPLGGRIEFGESSVAALQREIKEEIGAELADVTLIDVMENFFTFDGGAGHEIVFVYDAALRDATLYAMERITGHEDNGKPFDVIWLDLDALEPETSRVYPEGLLELLQQAPLRKNPPLSSD